MQKKDPQHSQGNGRDELSHKENSAVERGALQLLILRFETETTKTEGLYKSRRGTPCPYFFLIFAREQR